MTADLTGVGAIMVIILAGMLGNSSRSTARRVKAFRCANDISSIAGVHFAGYDYMKISPPSLDVFLHGSRVSLLPSV